MKKMEFEGMQQVMILPEAVTAAQLDLLNRVIATLTNTLCALRQTASETNKKNDGGVEESIEASIIGLSTQIDNITADASRWSLDFQKMIQARADEAHAINIAFQEAQIKAAEELTTPHFRYRPAFKRMEDGMWVAYLGDLNTKNPADLILGMGRTPQDAIKAFDSMFNGELPKHMLDWLLQVESAATAGVPPPAPPNTSKASNTIKNEQSNQSKHRPLETRRNRRIKKTTGGGGNPS